MQEEILTEEAEVAINDLMGIEAKADADDEVIETADVVADEDVIETTDEESAEEKAIVKINADGSVAKCAKGLTEGCGYKAGAKVCGKCGAMAVEVKANKPMAETTMEDATDGPDGEAAETTVDDMEEPMDAMNAADRKRRLAARKRRMSSMRVKSEDWDDDAYLCGFQRKMLAGNAEPCFACPGGCAPESDLPTLIEVEGLAEEDLDGKVIHSGYSEMKDEFILNIQRKDGEIAEAHYDATTAEMRGWYLLDKDLIGEKSAIESIPIISVGEAATAAVGTFPGEVIGVSADLFDGYDAYSIEIKSEDGRSYDVFVSLDGDVIGYDEHQTKSDSYEAEDELDDDIIVDEIDEVESEDAELDLKDDEEDVEQKSIEDPAFLASLMEFDLLAIEEDL